MIKSVIVIVISILFIFFIAHLFLTSKVYKKDKYITLNEVIPEARIISETEGIIEYNGKKFILGLTDLNRKRELINILRLDTISGYTVVDMRFRREIIVR
ncbi:MAG: hypothetical protein ABIL07_04375 [candidate division WOR-3 bacterium]